MGPEINWVQNDPKKYNCFTDGSVFLVTLEVSNRATGKTTREFDVVEFDCDGEGAALWYRNKSEPYDAWSWDDFDYFALLEGEMPTADESVHVGEADGKK